MINRRTFLNAASRVLLGLLAYNGLNRIGERLSYATNDLFEPDVELSISAKPRNVKIFEGLPTKTWSYTGEVIKGSGNNLINDENTYMGPIVQVQKGQRVRIHFMNQLPVQSIIHWHGLHVPAQMDGHPSHVIPGGSTFTYEFKVINQAGTYWYHPHPHGRTGHQVYGGLAGLFIVSDPGEKALNLPSNDHDIPLVIQDRIFDDKNQLVYLPNGMMDSMTGMLGNKIMINGIPDFSLSVATRVYRLRLLNGSNSRVYKLAWDDGSPLVVIGTDGGLLEKPVEKKYVFLAPGERIELWADFSNYLLGAEKKLISKYFEDAVQTSGMGPGMMHRNRSMERGYLPNGARFSILTIKVTRKEAEKLRLPDKLASYDRFQIADADNRRNPRQFRLFMRHMHGLINGRTFEMAQYSKNETVKLNTMELWEFINDENAGMMMMPMPHPMHLHGAQFQIVQRSGVTHTGYVDNGWKDTVLLMPGERIKILTRFEKYHGMFLYHCHNLEHGDMGMMRNYYVAENNKQVVHT